VASIQTLMTYCLLLSDTYLVSGDGRSQILTKDFSFEPFIHTLVSVIALENNIECICSICLNRMILV